MNKREFVIISALRQDSRCSLTKMSRMTSIPISTLHDKLKDYRGSLIKKNTTIVDFSKLGYNTRASVMFRVDKGQREQFINCLKQCSHVNTLVKINNGFDFLVEFIFENIKDMEDYMELLDRKFTIVGKETYYLIEDIKREAFLSTPRNPQLKERSQP
ncbi:MAG: Lrp/AsnC family transcriptional regulator [Candidatus Woesearchaeota archaeon]